MSNVRLDQVRMRRRIAMRLGFVALIVACAAACIFEKGDYQGGGRSDKGASASNSVASSASADAEVDAAQPVNPFIDAGGG